MKCEVIHCDAATSVVCDGCGVRIHDPLKTVYQVTMALKIIFFCDKCKRVLER